MIRITSDKAVAEMSSKNVPVAYCEDGDTVIFDTLDCSGGSVRQDGTKDTTPNKYLANPATGPLYVNGAKRGDLLKVEILSLKHASWGYMGTGKREEMYPGIVMDFPTRIFTVSDGYVSLGGKRFPLDPMIGVIGVAPEGEAISTLVPSFHGGNMDCTRIRQGSTLYFPVFADGALLAMGDLHAVMGDGEVFLYGLETAGEVTVRVSVIKGKKLRMPVVIDGGVFAVIASAKTLDECSRLAVKQLYEIMLDQGWKEADLGYLLSLKCNLAVCQIVDPNMTVRAEIPLELLSPAQ